MTTNISTYISKYNQIVQLPFAYYTAASLDSNISNNSGISNFLHPAGGSDKERQNDYNGLDFRVIVDYKSGPPVNITLVASSLQEKAAWCSDISQVWMVAYFILKVRL